MPTRVSIAESFRKDLKRLARKYAAVLEVVQELVTTLEKDERPGDKIPNVGFDVYKVRLKNPSAGRGKRGGFRVIYYVQLVNSVVLLTIYSKSDKTDITPDELRQVLDSIPSSDEQNDP